MKALSFACEAGEKGINKMTLTSFFVEDQFCLEFPPLVQSTLDLCHQPVTGLWPIEEMTRAALLHQLCAGITSELTEAIRTVHDGVERLNLCVPQHKVTVCERKNKNKGKDMRVCS